MVSRVKDGRWIRWFPIVVSLACLATFVGCGGLLHIEPRHALHIETDETDTLRVDGRRVRAEHVLEAVRAAGADANTRITIRVHTNASPNAGVLLRQRLVQGGFPKVVIARRTAPSATVAPVRVR